MNNIKPREKLVLTKEQARSIIYEDTDEYDIISDEMIGKRRWSIDYYVVIKRVADGKFFADLYSRGATEYQDDERPFEYTVPNFTEVFPVEKKIIVYQ